MLNTIIATLFNWSPYVLAILLLIILFRRFMPSFIKIWIVKLLAMLMWASYVVGFFHYTLPQRDIVLLLDSYEKRMDVSNNALFWGQPDAGTLKSDTRDVRFVDAQRPDGSVIVYRNEDTSFGWPPYFKFDSSNLGAEVKQLLSTPDDPKWVAVRHYGWRNTIFSIFPNMTSVKQVAGPDVRLIPWFNIVFFIILSLIILGIYRLMQKFKRSRIDPLVEGAEDVWDDVATGSETMGDKVRNWFKRLGGKP